MGKNFILSASKTQGETSVQIQEKISIPQYYYVVVVAGQQNNANYGEGMASVQSWSGTYNGKTLPSKWTQLGVDDPHPRIKQLSRGNDNGAAGTPQASNQSNLQNPLTRNTIVPATHCCEHAQDSRGLGNPNQPTNTGCVGMDLAMAKRLLSYIPPEAGILLVPCSFGGTAFTTGTDAAFNTTNLQTHTAGRWGVQGGSNAGGTVVLPLSGLSFQYGVGVGTSILGGRYCDMVVRTAIALAQNPRNRLLGVVWGQGEFDQTATPANHQSLFEAMVAQFITDINNNTTLKGQCPLGNATNVPWVCMADTCYHWRKATANYWCVYQTYRNSNRPQVVPVVLGFNDDGSDVETNLEDTGDTGIGRWGQTGNVQGTRQTHYQANARRGIISQKFQEALVFANRNNSILIGQAGYLPPVLQPNQQVIAYDASQNRLPSARGHAVENEACMSLVADQIDQSQTRALSIVPTATVANWQTQPLTYIQWDNLWNNGGRLWFKIRPTPATAPGTGKFLNWVTLATGERSPTGTAKQQFAKILVRTGSSNSNLVEVCYQIGGTHTVIGQAPYQNARWIMVEAIFQPKSTTVRFAINGRISQAVYTMQTNDYVNNMRGVLGFTTVSSNLQNLCNHAFGGWGLIINDQDTPTSYNIGITPSPPQATAGAALGTQPTVGQIVGVDEKHTLSPTSGTQPTQGLLMQVSFATAFQAQPIINVTPGNSAQASLGLYATTTQTGYQLYCSVAPTASTALSFNVYIG